MTKILVVFLLSASFFVFPAQAQEKGKTSAFSRSWEVTPAVDSNWMKPESEQPQSMKDSAARTEQNKGVVGPKGMNYSAAPDQPPPIRAIHMGLQKKDKIQILQTVEAEDPEPQGNFTELRQMDTASVDQIIDPLRIRLKDRRIIQLAGINIPDFNLDDPGDNSIAARYYLEKLLVNKQVRLYQTKDSAKGRTNRMGYLLGHLVVSGDAATWVQGALLSQGLARVQPSSRNAEMVNQMVALEDKAREKRKGIWAGENYKVLTPETAAQGLNDWAIVEGRVKATALNQNTLYLNFGDDWRSDFTIVVTPDVRRQFVKKGIDPLKLGGKVVRVRGWLEDYNGPSLELADIAWLEMPDETAPPGKAPFTATPAPPMGEIGQDN